MGIPISQLPSISGLSGADLFARDDMTQLDPDNRTQQSTLSQLLYFIQQNIAMAYPCLVNPNTESIFGFFGSTAIGSENGTIWQKQSAGYTSDGWVVIYGDPSPPPPLLDPLADSFISYSNGAYVNGLNGGTPVGPPLMTMRGAETRDIEYAGFWAAPYDARGSLNAVQLSDTFESYDDQSFLSGGNAGFNNPPLSAWNGVYVARASFNAVQLTDDFESYANLAPVNGLNLGVSNPPRSTWVGAYVARPSFDAVKWYDDFEAYADSTPLSGANLGTGWSAPYTVH